MSFLTGDNPVSTSAARRPESLDHLADAQIFVAVDLATPEKFPWSPVGCRLAERGQARLQVVQSYA